LQFYRTEGWFMARKKSEKIQEPVVTKNEEIQEAQIIQDTDNTLNIYKMFSGMSLDDIQEFLNTVSQKLTTDDLVYVDLTEAQTVSTPIVQAIISLNRFAGHTNKKIKWQNPSTGFSDAFNNLGFYSEMMRLEFA
jgi:hypothetical protein